MSPVSELEKKGPTILHHIHVSTETSTVGPASPAVASLGEARSSLSDLLHEKALRTCHRLHRWHLHRDLLKSICAAYHWQNNKGDSGKLPKCYITSQSKTTGEHLNQESVNLKISVWRGSKDSNEMLLQRNCQLPGILIHFAYICWMVYVPFFGAITEHKHGRRLTGK